MRRSQIRNNLQICPRQDSNTGGKWSVVQHTTARPWRRPNIPLEYSTVSLTDSSLSNSNRPTQTTHNFLNNRLAEIQLRLQFWLYARRHPEHSALTQLPSPSDVPKKTKNSFWGAYFTGFKQNIICVFLCISVKQRTCDICIINFIIPSHTKNLNQTIN